ncbi:MAG: type 11 methyltransferase [Parcubacteria group bacterium Greene0714_4]|nr:MAG: type 11 methyltransferase [Parcubacteria group bacterium Greene1014_15]TSD07037.1 MAG: type 11 methyltransferase [Parcubacteria group bacterium Greene0714_4]
MSFTEPQSNIDQFMIPEGARVADLGAGSGMYTIAAARAVGDTGRVLSVEVQKELLVRLQTAAKGEGLSNIDVIWGDIEKLGGTKIRDMSIDAAIVSNVLFQIEDRRDFMTELKRILKPRGKVLVVDWSGSYGGMGPTPEQVVSEQDVKTLFDKHDMVFERSINAGDNHYGLIFRNT